MLMPSARLPLPAQAGSLRRTRSVVGETAAFVLDSFALLAFLQKEAGGPVVQGLLTRAQTGDCSTFLSLINLGEVLYIIEREQSLVAAQRTLSAVEQLPLQIEPISRTTVLAAAHLKAHYPIAYADAFAIVAARERAAVLVTGDPEFEPVAKAGIVQVQWLPGR